MSYLRLLYSRKKKSYLRLLYSRKKKIPAFPCRLQSACVISASRALHKPYNLFYNLFKNIFTFRHFACLNVCFPAKCCSPPPHSPVTQHPRMCVFMHVHTPITCTCSCICLHLVCNCLCEIAGLARGSFFSTCSRGVRQWFPPFLPSQRLSRVFDTQQ